MPDKVRIVQRKDRRFDAYIEELITSRGYGHERAYAGVESQELAAEVRRKLRTAGRHLGVAVRAFWEPCSKPGRCPAGASCRFHVRYAAFQLEDARTYKAKASGNASGNASGTGAPTLFRKAPSRTR